MELPYFSPQCSDDHGPRARMLDLYGVPLLVVLAPGDVRSGTNAFGEPWAVTMPCYYCEVVGLPSGAPDEGPEERVDAFVGSLDTERVWVVDLVAPSGALVEQKLVFGYADADQVRGMLWDVYQGAFSAGVLAPCSPAPGEPASGPSGLLLCSEVLQHLDAGGQGIPSAHPLDWVPAPTEPEYEYREEGLPVRPVGAVEYAEGEEADGTLAWEAAEHAVGTPEPLDEDDLPGVLRKARTVPIGTETVRRDGARWRKVEAGKWQQIKDGKSGLNIGDTNPDQPGAEPIRSVSAPMMDTASVKWAASFGLDGNLPGPDIHPSTVRVDADGDIDTKPVLTWTDTNGVAQRSYTVPFHFRRYRSLRQKIAGSAPAIAKAFTSLQEAKTDADSIILLSLLTGTPPATLMDTRGASVATTDADTHFVLGHAAGHVYPVSLSSDVVPASVKGKAGSPDKVFSVTEEEVARRWKELQLPTPEVTRGYSIALMSADLASKAPKVDFTNKAQGVEQLRGLLSQMDATIGERLGHGPPPDGMTYVPPAMVAAIAEDAGAAKWYPRAFGYPQAPTRGMKIAMAHGTKNPGASELAKSWAKRNRDGITPEEAELAMSFFEAHPDIEAGHPNWADALCYGGRTAHDFFRTMMQDEDELWEHLAASRSVSGAMTSSTATSSTTSMVPERQTSTQPTRVPESETPGLSPAPSLSTPTHPADLPQETPGPSAPAVPPASSPAETVAASPVASTLPSLAEMAIPKPAYPEGFQVLVLRQGEPEVLTIHTSTDTLAVVEDSKGAYAVLDVEDIRKHTYVATEVVSLAHRMHAEGGIPERVLNDIVDAAVSGDVRALTKGMRAAMDRVRQWKGTPAAKPAVAVVHTPAVPYVPDTRPVPTVDTQWTGRLVKSMQQDVAGYLRGMRVVNRADALDVLMHEAPEKVVATVRMLTTMGGRAALNAAIAAATRRG